MELGDVEQTDLFNGHSNHSPPNAHTLERSESQALTKSNHDEDSDDTNCKC